MQTTQVDGLTAKECEIVSAFLVFLDGRFNELTVNTLDRSESYWHEACARWVKDFGKSRELAGLVEGMKPAEIMRALMKLPQFAFARITTRRQSESGW